MVKDSSRGRGRDRLGRPVPLDDPGALPPVPEHALPHPQAVALAQSLLDEDRCFAAHEVLEASWKAAPDDERALWQGLAQVCVGATHLQRGNRTGAARLLRRGAGSLDAVPEAALAVLATVVPAPGGAAAAPVGLDVAGVRAWALALADAVDRGAVPDGSADAPWDGPGGRLRLSGT